MKKILLIDDDPSMFLLLKEALSKQDLHLDQANDGKEGLAKVKSVQPDLIILDIFMPPINGFEVLDQLKANASTKSIPVVIYSFVENEKDVETALSKGAIDYVSKTQYDPPQLLEKIKKLV